jgi:hypothetical protein
MVLEKIINLVQYPDQTEGIYPDAEPYDDVISGLQDSLVKAKGQLKIDLEETITELERRWEERKNSILKQAELVEAIEIFKLFKEKLTVSKPPQEINQALDSVESYLSHLSG